MLIQKCIFNSIAVFPTVNHGNAKMKVQGLSRAMYIMGNVIGKKCALHHCHIEIRVIRVTS